MVLDVMRARDLAGTVIASCRARCSLKLPSGRYRIVAHGNAPTREHAIDLDGTTRVVVRPGSSVGRVSVSGDRRRCCRELGAHPVALAPPCDRIDGNCGQGPWLTIGLIGLGALAGGLVFLGTTRTELDVTTDDTPPAGSPRLPTARGVGVAF